MRYWVLSLLWLVAPLAHGSWSLDESVAPVERLIENVEKWIIEHPDDSRGYYTLGRIHYLAGDKEGRFLAYAMRGQGPNLPLSFTELPTVYTPRFTAELIDSTSTPPPELEARAMRRTVHLFEAERNLRRAVGMDPDQALYHLTLGSLCMEVVRLNLQAFGVTIIPLSGRDWEQEARDEMAKAFLLTVDADSSRITSRDQLFGLDGVVSLEAAGNYLNLEGGDPTLKEKMEEHRARMNKLPVMITPIIMALDNAPQLADLLDPSHAVTFDLDGTGRPQLWPWVKPETGMLVWDPQKTGIVTSGRQLFGSVTWWMFWDSGYQALAALDDDRDGWLRGRELVGLALWFDRNQNGRSDPGEVVPLESTNVEAISVRPDAREAGGAWRATRGVMLKGGTVLPTWDWVAQSLEKDEISRDTYDGPKDRTRFQLDLHQ